MRPAELIEALLGRCGLQSPHAIETGQFLQNLLIVGNGRGHNAGHDFGCGRLRIEHLLAASVGRGRENNQGH